jgi:hypothetical protein
VFSQRQKPAYKILFTSASPYYVSILTPLLQTQVSNETRVLLIFSSGITTIKFYYEPTKPNSHHRDSENLGTIGETVAEVRSVLSLPPPPKKGLSETDNGHEIAFIKCVKGYSHIKCIKQYTGCSKKSFTNLEAYVTLFR